MNCKKCGMPFDSALLEKSTESLTCPNCGQIYRVAVDPETGEKVYRVSRRQIAMRGAESGVPSVGNENSIPGSAVQAPKAPVSLQSPPAAAEKARNMEAAIPEKTGQSVGRMQAPQSRPNAGQSVGGMQAPQSRPNAGQSVGRMQAPQSRPNAGQNGGRMQAPQSRPNAGQSVGRMQAPQSRPNAGQNGGRMQAPQMRPNAGQGGGTGQNPVFQRKPAQSPQFHTVQNSAPSGAPQFRQAPQNNDAYRASQFHTAGQSNEPYGTNGYSGGPEGNMQYDPTQYAGWNGGQADSYDQYYDHQAPYGNSQGGYSMQQGGYAMQQDGYPMQQGGYPMQQGGYPMQSNQPGRAGGMNGFAFSAMPQGFVNKFNQSRADAGDALNQIKTRVPFLAKRIGPLPMLSVLAIAAVIILALVIFIPRDSSPFPEQNALVKKMERAINNWDGNLFLECYTPQESNMLKQTLSLAGSDASVLFSQIGIQYTSMKVEMTLLNVVLNDEGNKGEMTVQMKSMFDGKESTGTTTMNIEKVNGKWYLYGLY